MEGCFVVFEWGQNGPLESRAAGQMLPAGANVLYVSGLTESGAPSETWLTHPDWPFWDQHNPADWGDAAVKPGETLGQFVQAVKAENPHF